MHTAFTPASSSSAASVRRASTWGRLASRCALVRDLRLRSRHCRFTSDVRDGSSEGRRGSSPSSTRCTGFLLGSFGVFGSASLPLGLSVMDSP
ncbi:MAG: hypothetical protein R5N92_00395 [Cutibacterium granulosum]|nr:hypothetical protein [Cutibacterium granulosum]